MDYSKLSDFEINNLVAISLGAKVTDSYRVGEERETVYYSLGGDEFAIRRGFGNINDDFDPCQKPNDAWPIISENGISLIKCTVGSGYWSAEIITDIDDVTDKRFQCQSSIDSQDANPLRAAMIVFLMMQESANVQDNPT